MPDIAVIETGTYYLRETMSAHPPVGSEVVHIDVYDLPHADLTRYAGLVVPGPVDQELLLREAHRIRAFLDSGRVLTFTGHLFRPWLPGARPFVPKGVDAVQRIPRGVHSSAAYNVHVIVPHPVFEGVLQRDLTLRRGVRGFFARGHHPPPDGAEILLALESGEPITYVDRSSTGGTVLVHAGADLLGYVGDDTTAARVAPQLLRWMRDEFARLQAARPSR